MSSVLVPGDRQISWPRLRALLGVSRMSMPDAATADERVRGRRVTLGGGAHGVAVAVDADAALAALSAQVADVSDPE
jgi:Cys-tRNA(Pro)/Cys-tRNA(Cys) deacylase